MNLRTVAVAACLHAGICWLPSPLSAATLASAEGEVTVTTDGLLSSADQVLQASLAAGTTIATAEDSRALLQLGPGLYLDMEPLTQVVVGQTREAGVLDAAGQSLPQAVIFINAGSVVLISSEEGLAVLSVALTSPRGTVTPVNPGLMYVSVFGLDPGDSTLTVAFVSGDGIFTSTEGDPVPVGEGLVLGLEGERAPVVDPLADVNEGANYRSTAESSSTRVQNLVATSSTVEPTPTLTTFGEISPEPTPRSTPTPTPTPRPTPEPTPTPRPTPEPTPTPRPTPEPTPTPRPTPEPTPTPRPTPEPTPTPRPTPTPTPTPRPTPVSP